MLSDLIETGHKVRQLTPGKARIGLHCMAISVGFEKRFNEAYSWDGLKRGADPFIVVQHTLSGEGQLDFAGTRHTLTVGETMVLSFPHQNRYWLKKGDAWEYFWLILNGREALRIVRALIDLGGPVLRLPQANVEQLATATHRLLNTERLEAGEISAQAYAALMALQDGAMGEAKDDEVALPAAIARTRDHIETHLSERLDVERLARAAQMSRAHFVRLFARSVGQPPSDYVFERRMERAARLLLATDNSVLAVSQACGFADANYFSKAFRRTYGRSPTQYRGAGETLLPRRHRSASGPDGNG